ncbi:glycoside hydrolase family 2 TIM barrel-domain containing protein [Mangrovibacterium marinum]|uniref:Beta-galactosidase n=1 Tax=Mangrovibacterium marinum TaxID=1639118 RepID=A0A2T5C671_9BACT|nr:glycoside hydrolase family 2 TIM barrel-domain containing protein [Mangrovibacterium marinum]PTN10449.1 beta-galactosidase/beta-glucuronidase [Mangrovibacterium marinum]
MKTYFFLAFLLLLTNYSIDLSAQDRKETMFLSGTDNENTATWDFFCTSGRKSGVWSKIEVPSHWEQQGFGEYDYGRDYRTYGKKFKFADETGIYKHSFTVPENWKDKDIFIVFDGSMTDSEVKVNGELAGPIHQGSFYQFRYNISDKLKAGENELEVTVHKNSANASVNRAERYADYWIFGGIFRPVYLEAFPKSYIERVAIAAKADGSFSMDAFPVNAQKKQSIYAEIIDADGAVVKTCETKISPKDSLVTLSCQVDNPATWTSETPNRYSVKVSLKEGNNTKYELNEKFGFRTIEIRQGDGIYVNGVKIKIKGINRHVFWPETGRCSNARIDLNDVKLMKEMNLNAVRCAHYPPDKSFLNFCDSLGLYVLDELAGWQNAYDTESGSKLVREMVIHDVNHPSIILWSNGNEGGTNKELDDDFDIYDPSKRPVIHAHHKPGNDYNGIDCNHYENYYSTKKILEDKLIYMPTEFLHAQDDGGAAASLADFWELHWNSKLGAGGFIWNFSDEGIVRTDLDNAIDVNRVNAPDGVLGPHREKEGSYYALRQIYSPVKIDLKKLPGDFDGTIAVENRFHFTNLNECKFTWELVNFVQPEVREAGHKVMANGTATAPDVAPVSKGELKLNLPSDYKKYDGLYLRAFDQHGNELYCWSWKTNGNRKEVLKLVEKSLGEDEKALLEELKAQGVEEDNILPIEQQKGDDSGLSSKVELTEDEEQVILKASGIAVSFSKKNGTILKVTNDFGLPIPFGNGPVLVSGNAELTGVSHHEAEGAQVLEMTYSGDIKKLSWTMYTSGWLELNYEYQVADKQLFTGITFSFPESDIISAKWLGDGPAHVWKNRLQGGQLDVYQRLYNTILPATNSWGDQFKGYYADVSWMEFNTVHGKFTVVAQEPDLFVRLFSFYGISGPENYPQLPAGDISFLDGIPPIGTKLAMGISNDTWNLGPSGELNVMEKPVNRTLYFYFGLR